MALLSCSMRSVSSQFSAHVSSRVSTRLLIAHSFTCSGSDFSKSVTSRTARAISEPREFDSVTVTSVAEFSASPVPSLRSVLIRRVFPVGIVESPVDEEPCQNVARATKSDFAASPAVILDDVKQEVQVGVGVGVGVGAVGGRSTLLGSCAGISLTPGIASALPLPSVSMHDLVACAITIAGALSMLKFFDELAKREVLEKKLSRKLVHIFVGLGYLLFWPLFSAAPYAPYLCALAPAGNGVRMLGLGFGLLENEAMVRAMSREGDRRELLKGPFYYALAIVVTTVCFWRTSPVGIVALVNLCAGDGFADIIGRNFGGESKLPWNEDKSWAGSVAFFLASTGVSILYLLYFAHFGFLQMQPGIFAGVAIVSFLTALVESLPISTRLDDNLTVPFAAMALGQFILPS